ncbi:MAG: PAS domain S-box protein [Acidobacteriia bacterium]|nr:PAS domain S-box protein [Terriglobia bacterium]
MSNTPHVDRPAPARPPLDGKAVDPYRVVFDMNPQPMWVCDAQSLRILAANDAAVLKYEYSRPELLAMTAEALLTADAIPRFLEQHRADASAQTDETEGIWRHCSKTGRVFDVEMWSRIIPFEGRPARLMTVQDITARRHAENSLSTRYALTRLLTESPADVMSKALRCLGESLEFDLAELWLVDPAGTHLNRQTSWYSAGLDGAVAGPANLRLSIQQRKGTLTRVLAYGTPCWIPEAGEEPGYEKRSAALQAAGIANGLAFAIRNHEEVSGVVVLLRRGQSPPDPQILQLLVDIGSQIGHNLERSRVEQELREAEESFRVLFDDAPIPCHEIDRNGIIVRVNQAQCEVFGKEAPEMLGKPIWDLVVPEQREECRSSVKKKFAVRRTGTGFERRFRTRNGGESVFRVHDRLLVNPKGEVTGMRGAMLDLTEARRSRQQIELQTTLLDQANDSIITVDLGFCVTYWNSAAERLFGWSAQEILGQPYKVAAGTVVTEDQRETIHADILKRGSWNGEIICTSRSGTQFVVSLSWSVLHDANGQPTGAVGIHRDITAPKQMEQALRATEDRLKLAQSALALGTWEVDLGSHTVRCSPQLMRMYGLPDDRDQLSVEQWHGLVHPEDRPDKIAGAQSLFEGREAFDRQFRVIWPDGSVRWLHSKARVIFDEEQRAMRVIGVDFDITEHKCTEERLRILSSAVEQSPVSILITGLDGRIDYVNEKLTQSTGYEFEELKGKTPHILSSDDTPPEQYARIAAAMETGEWRGIVKSKKKTGDVFWQSASILWIRDTAGRPTHQLAVAEDITERLKMEEALKVSEERFRIAAESSGDSIYEWDLKSDAVTLFGGNQKSAPAFGWTPPWMGRDFRKLMHPADRDRVEAAIQRHLEQGDPYTLEYRIVTPGGEAQYYVDQGSALRDAHGEPYKWIGVCRDVTEQKKVERANAELAAIVECADTAIISLDLAGEVLTWNQGAERVYGYTTGEMVGRSISRLIPPDRNSEDTELLARLCRGESVHHLETTRLTKSGELIHVLLTLSPIRDRNGAVLGMAHVAWDITQIKQLERQLAQTQKLESIGHLAAGIAHEINTPIQYIGDNGKFLEDAFRDLLKFAEQTAAPGVRSPSDAGAPAVTQSTLDQGVLDYLQGEVPKAIEQLLEGVDQVAHIVRAMKEFSHPGPIEKMPIDLNRAIESTILVSKNEWKYVAELTTDLDRQLPPVPCVAGEFNQVILNLIVNAAHAISDVVKDSGGKGTISIRTRRNGSHVEVRVSDTGCGIPAANQSKVFDPFFTTKPVGKGTGQGLAIAHAVVVQKHSGSITLESELGSGTTFVIQLPLAPELEGE